MGPELGNKDGQIDQDNPWLQEQAPDNIWDITADNPETQEQADSTYDIDGVIYAKSLSPAEQARNRRKLAIKKALLLSLSVTAFIAASVSKRDYYPFDATYHGPATVAATTTETITTTQKIEEPAQELTAAERRQALNESIEEELLHTKLGDEIELQDGTILYSSSTAKKTKTDGNHEESTTVDESISAPAGKYIIDQVEILDEKGDTLFCRYFNTNGAESIYQIYEQAYYDARGKEKKPAIINVHCTSASEGEATEGWVRNWAYHIMNESQTSAETNKSFETATTKEYKGGLEDVSRTHGLLGIRSEDGQEDFIYITDKHGKLLKTGDITIGYSGKEYQITSIEAENGHTEYTVNPLRLAEGAAISGVIATSLTAAFKKEDEEGKN